MEKIPFGSLYKEISAQTCAIILSCTPRYGFGYLSTPPKRNLWQEKSGHVFVLTVVNFQYPFFSFIKVWPACNAILLYW